MNLKRLPLGKRESKILSDAQLRHWVSAGEPLAKSDGDGLTFTLSSAGLAAWVLRYRYGGRRAEITLGRYPDLGLAQARKEAAARRVAISNGENPALERRREKIAAATSLTVKQVVDSYRAVILPKKADKTQITHNYHLDRFIKPALGPMLARDVQAADIIAMIEGAKKPWPTSEMMLNTTNRLFAHAAGKRIIPANPCAGIELSSVLGDRPPRRPRISLKEPELRILLARIDDVGRQNGLCLRMLLGTAVRSVELCKSRWSEVDFDRAEWTIPAERIKTRAAANEPFVIPLTPLLVSWLRELQELAGGSAFLFPARDDRRINGAVKDTHQAENTMSAAISRLFAAGLEKVRRFTPHDLRSTVKSHMRDLGISGDITERVLNHKLRGVEGVYDKHDYVRERREALNLWCQFLIACETGVEWNVSPMRRSA